MWDLLSSWVFGADCGHARVTSFARLGQRVVARVKIFALLDDDGQWRTIRKERLDCQGQ